MSSTRFARGWAGAAFIALAALLASGNALAHDEKPSFVASWAAGHINPLPEAILRFSNQTVREVVRASVGGELVRVGKDLVNCSWHLNHLRNFSRARIACTMTTAVSPWM